MLIYEKNIGDINLDDIKSLVEDEIDENNFIEYKGELDKNGEKKHIPRTICGFANSEGGILIYGFDEDQDGFKKIQGVTLNNTWEREKQRLINLFRDNIEPYLDIGIEKVDLNNGNVLIIIKTPKSWISPHRVKRGQEKDFYIRRNGRTEPMEFNEIKEMFEMNNKLTERINGFRCNRVLKYSTEDTNHYKVICHSIPLNSFSNIQINLEEAKKQLIDYRVLSPEWNYNFEGIYQSRFDNFGQMFRNGIFERVKKTDCEDDPVSLVYFENEFKNFVKQMLKVYESLNIFCPIIFFVTLTNIKGRDVSVDSFYERRGDIFDKERNILDPSGIIFESEESIDEDISRLFLQFWNHFGYDKKYEKRR
ncbi:helix-turn-helix domain-containing protein [Methanobrevibacter smithii]|uniref:helix-turn-helix domain-containing protein n=1 Tax=Methanobrevibacter smithii TaxID=2173 RepID=UPI0037DC1A48